MGRKVDQQAREYAYLLYMSGEMQKDICSRVGINARTLKNMIDDGGWAEKRTAKTVTRTELINKTLTAMAQLLDRLADKNENADDLKGIPDQLSKFMSTLKSLDKGGNVIDDIDTFMNFNNWLRARMKVDKELTIDLVKAINRMQDAYVTEKLAQK